MNPFTVLYLECGHTVQWKHPPSCGYPEVYACPECDSPEKELERLLDTQLEGVLKNPTKNLGLG
jgi:hypothetical protein